MHVTRTSQEWSPFSQHHHIPWIDRYKADTHQSQQKGINSTGTVNPWQLASALENMLFAKAEIVISL